MGDLKKFKKRKQGKGKGRLVRVLFLAKFEFSKILAPRLPQNISNVNIENTGKSKQLYYLCIYLFSCIYLFIYQFLGALIYLHFIVLILIFFKLTMPGINYAINGCSSSRTTLGA